MTNKKLISLRMMENQIADTAIKIVGIAGGPVA